MKNSIHWEILYIVMVGYAFGRKNKNSISRMSSKDIVSLATGMNGRTVIVFGMQSEQYAPIVGRHQIDEQKGQINVRYPDPFGDVPIEHKMSNRMYPIQSCKFCKVHIMRFSGCDRELCSDENCCGTRIEVNCFPHDTFGRPMLWYRHKSAYNIPKMIRVLRDGGWFVGICKHCGKEIASAITSAEFYNSVKLLFGEHMREIEKQSATECHKIMLAGLRQEDSLVSGLDSFIVNKIFTHVRA